MTGSRSRRCAVWTRTASTSVLYAKNCVSVTTRSAYCVCSVSLSPVRRWRRSRWTSSTTAFRRVTRRPSKSLLLYMRNGQITVKGSWVRPLNCLETNIGRIYIGNYSGWYNNPESFWVLEKGAYDMWYIVRCVHCL